MTHGLVRALGRIARVLSAYLAMASIVLYWRADTVADLAVAKLLLVLTGGSILLVGLLVLEGSRASGRESSAAPARDDWVDQ